MGRKLNILAFAAFLFLIVALVYRPLGNGIVNGINSATGGALGGLQTFGADLNANPIYQTYHPLVWIAIGVILTGLFIRADKKGKIPFRKRGQMTQQPQMQQPTTVILQQQPVPVNPNAQTTQPAAVTNNAPAPPVDPTKQNQTSTTGS